MANDDLMHKGSKLPDHIQRAVEDAAIDLLSKQEAYLELVLKEVGTPAEEFFKDHVVEFEPVEMNMLDAPDRLNVVYLGITQKMRVRRKTREERLADESRTNEGVSDQA